MVTVVPRAKRLLVADRAENIVMEALNKWMTGSPERVATLHLDGTAHLAATTDVVPGARAVKADPVAAWDPPANNLSRDQLGDADWSDEDIDIATDWLLTEWLTAREERAVAGRKQRARARARAAICQECQLALRGTD